MIFNSHLIKLFKIWYFVSRLKLYNLIINITRIKRTIIWNKCIYIKEEYKYKFNFLFVVCVVLINKNIEISFESIKNCLTSLFLTILEVIHSVMLKDVFACYKKMWVYFVFFRLNNFYLFFLFFLHILFV